MRYTSTALATLSGGNLTFTAVVPGQQLWTIRSILAVATRGAGGAPNRSYLLSFTDGTSTVAQMGAADAGTDPGTCTITWADASPAAIGLGNAGFSLAPIVRSPLPPGYNIIGTFKGNVAGDAWTSARVWFDYVDTGP